MALVDNLIVKKDIKAVLNSEIINWEQFRNKTIFITGATGGIGSFLIQCLLNANEEKNLGLKVIANVRNRKKALELFTKFLYRKDFKLFVSDVTNKIKYKNKVDFIVHCANNTSSKSFVEQPVETIDIALNGTKNVLDFAVNKKAKSVVYLSSMEVYGEINENKLLSEKDLGEMDLLEVRSSYPMGKRAAETLCYAYFKEYNLPIKIARLAQVIGANVDYDDTRVYAQFARSIVEKKDIVLKTTGETIRSYCYITDVITALLLLLEKGQNGEAYNIANKESTCSIKQITKMLTEKYSQINLTFDIDKQGLYPKETIWTLNPTKIENLGWHAYVDLKTMYDRLVGSFYCQKMSYLKTTQKRTFLQKIFSITNYEIKYKLIYILGFKIKIKKALTYLKYKNLSIDSNKIVFCNFKGDGYGCNPKYIAEEIIKRNLPYKLIWLVNNIEKEKKLFPNQIKLVEFNSQEAIKELATAKLWIDNQRKIKHIHKGLEKKDNQYYIQTWHGSLGIKKVGMDSFLTQLNNGWVPAGIKDAEMIDYLISNSEFENKVFDTNFWKNGKKLLLGHPRNDIFFYSKNQQNQIRAKVFDNLKTPEDKKILLYMPSFREDKRTDIYNIEIKSLLENIKLKFKNDYILVIRLHPDMKNMATELFKFNKDVINASLYPDIQELLVASDVAITDYSSCIFDFMLSRKPAFIYTEDIEKYNNERGFYYPLESTPFPIARNNEKLYENIRNFDYEKYKKEVEEFLREKGCIEDGHASEKVVDLIEEIMNNAK